MEEIVTSETVKVIVFQIKDKEYVIPVSKVRGIEKIMHITRVPRSLPFVKGVINLRGVITPIIDLRARFEIEKAEYDDRTRIIIVTLDNMEAGLIVDSANDVLDIPESSIEPQPEVIGNVAMEYISGVAKVEKRLLTLLNLDQILNQNEIHDSAVKEA
ncbi:chemotaxis protein CheW [Peribacillus loiseleuriae]|uniref:Chemotaxis protein CheW n=1 Tax=Peribacillus loiseleuriae TaxID=1679170 RepID=A0A0K9GS44_9BACI|nr:chemotaxis protein CheW [Peribacillus loiseleuriae]KMY49468.1 chemotaxis protein CheW [Peribacillus loiseleuriae]